MKSQLNFYQIFFCCVLPIFAFAQNEISSEKPKDFTPKYKAGIYIYPFSKYTYLEKETYHQKSSLQQNFSFFLETNLKKKSALIYRINVITGKFAKSIEQKESLIIDTIISTIDFNYLILFSDKEKEPSKSDFEVSDLYLGKGMSFDLAFQNYYRRREKGKTDVSYHIGLRTGGREYLYNHEEFIGGITKLEKTNNGDVIPWWLINTTENIYKIDGVIRHTVNQGVYYYANIIYGFSVGKELSIFPIHLGLHFSGQRKFYTSDNLGDKFKKSVYSLDLSMAYTF
jgi:hypothetical protein